MPDRAETGLRFEERTWLALEAQRQSPSAQVKRDRYLGLLNPQPGERLLDLGCGSGTLTRALARFVAPHGRVLGVEISPGAAALARRLAGAEGTGVLEFACADGHWLPFPDGSFDAAACVSVLEFCEDPPCMLAELQRVLRRGGRLLVANSDEDTRVYSGRDRALGRRITRAIADRGRDPWVGRRLAYLLTSAGFSLLHEAVITDVEHEYAPGTSGYAHAHLWRDYLVECGGISSGDCQQWVADLEARAHEGSYLYSVTTYTYLAGKEA